ncbi:stalk domain-containing protein [Cohnella sp. GCM10027633]|uniref:stalk domain-containing protein n=1 Tax=unclassified Cohnella TaxID=2636738 RepID=UPI0036267A23
MRIYRRVLSVLFMLSLLFPVATVSAELSEAEPLVVVDNKKINFLHPPVLVRGTLLVPLRELYEAVGAKVTEVKKASVYKVVRNAQQSGTYTIGSVTLVTARYKAKMLEPAQLIDGVAYVPIQSFVSVIPAIETSYGYSNYSLSTYREAEEKVYYTDLKGKALTEAKIKKMAATEYMTFKQRLTGFTLDYRFPFYELTSSRVMKQNGALKNAQVTFQGSIVQGQAIGTYHITVRDQKTKQDELYTPRMALTLPYKNGKVDFNIDQALKLYRTNPASISVNDKPISFHKKLIMESDHLLLPLLEGAQQIGYRVEEVEAGKRYKVTGDSVNTYELNVGKNTLITSFGEEININYFVPNVRVVDKTVMIPFDFISWFTDKTVEGDFPNYRMYSSSYDFHNEIRDEHGNAVEELSSGQPGSEAFHSLTGYAVPGKASDYRLELNRYSEGNEDWLTHESATYTGQVIGGFAYGTLTYTSSDQSCSGYFKLPIQSGKVELDLDEVRRLFGL